MKLQKIAPLPLAAILAGLAHEARAAGDTYHWDPSTDAKIQYGDGVWNTTIANFTQNTADGVNNVPWSNGAGNNVLSFPGSDLPATAPATVTVTLGSSISLEQISMGGNYAANVVINGGTNTITFTNSGSQLISNNSFSAKTLTLNTVLAGNNINLRKSNQGTVILTRANTYTGTTTVMNGTLVLGTGGSMVAGNALVLGNGGDSGVFRLGDANGAVNMNVSSLTTAGTGPNNAVVGGASAISTLTVDNASAVTFAGRLGGGGTNQNNLALAKSGAGVFTLSGANTYVGDTVVSGGTLALAAGGTLASKVYRIADGATFDVSAKSAYSLAEVSTTIGIGATGSGFFHGPTGTLTLGNALVLDFSTGTFTDGQTYTLFDFGTHAGDFSSVTLTGSITGSLFLGSPDTWTGNIGGYTFNFNEASGVLSVSTGAIPEPASFALVFGGFALAGGLCARRRRPTAA